MIKFNNSDIIDWNFDDSNIIKVYHNGAIVFYKFDSEQGGYKVCYAVVDDITQYSETEFEDVYDKATEKWYKLNNLNQYEEYGIYGSGRNVTTYEGKLTIDEEIIPSPSRLPTGYTEVEYIRNSNYNAYINTGVIPYDNTSNRFTVTAKVKSEYHSNLACATIIACEEVNSPYYGFGYRYKCSAQQNVLEFFGADGTVSKTSAATSDSAVTVTFTKTADSSKTMDVPLYIFGACGNASYTSATRYSDSTLYSMSVVKNNETIRDFIPAKRDSDSVYGLYDLITNTFYLSPNGNDFIGGSAVTPSTTATCEFMYSGGSWVNLGEVSGSSRVPAGYSEVEYIETDKTQYIDTGIYLNTSNFEVGYTIVGNSSCWGYCHQMVANGTWIGVESTTAWYGRWSSNTTYKVDMSSYLSSENNTIVYKQNGVTINGSTVSKSLRMGSDSIANKSLLFFGRYDFYKGGVEWQNNFKAKSLYIKNNGELVRDFVPAKRNSDSVYGLYDLINDVFYTSPNNVNFIGGAETGSTVYPKYYDEIADPLDGLTFNTLAEAQAYAEANCVYVGMHATIAGESYIFSGDSQSGYEWVEKLTAWYTLQDLINTHTVVSIGNNKYRFDPTVNGISYFRVHTDKVGGSGSYVDLYNDNLPSPPYFGIRDDSDIGLYQSVDGYINLKDAANSTSCTWAYWIDANTIEVNAQAIMNDTMMIGFYNGSFSKLLLSFELPTI